jgi:hypothetical protein
MGCLTPDRLTESKRSLESRRCSSEDQVSGQSARVIVDHSGQPGSDWLAARVSNEHVELGVIGLPDRIWVACAVAVHQLELVAEMSRRGSV